MIKNLLILSLVTIISFTSCVLNDKELGNHLVPDDYILKVGAYKFNINVTTSQPDSVQGFSNDYMLVGYEKNDEFGLAKSSSASYVFPTEDSLDLGINPELKEAYISLKIDSIKSNMEGQENIIQNLYVYKLNKDLDSNTISNISFSEEDIISVPNSRISIGSTVYTGGDSIKIRITDEFANELLKTTYEESNDAELFRKRIKGIYLTCGETNNVPNGGRMNYIHLSSSRIYIKYLHNNPDKNIHQKDTAQSFYFGVQKAVNLFRTNSKHLASNEPQENIYIEGLSGVKPFISKEDINNELNRFIQDSIPNYIEGSMIISRATLTLSYDAPKDYVSIDREFPHDIYPCNIQKLYEAENKMDYFQLPEDIFNSYNTGAINRSHQDYKMDITSYAQNLLLPKDKQNPKTLKDLWIFPILKYYIPSSQEISYKVNAISCSRAKLNGPLHKDKELRPTIDIVYSVLNLDK